MSIIYGMERDEAQSFELWLPGKVESWKRNRVGRTGRQFRDAKGLAYRSELSQAIHETFRGKLRAPVAVEMVFVFERPKTRPKEVPAEVWGLGVEVRRPTRGRDDIDRLQGNVLDGMKDAGVITDDGVVTDIFPRKVWAARGEVAGLLLRVTEARWV